MSATPLNKYNSIECNSVEINNRTNLTNQTKFRLNEISKI